MLRAGTILITFLSAGTVCMATNLVSVIFLLLVIVILSVSLMGAKIQLGKALSSADVSDCFYNTYTLFVKL